MATKANAHYVDCDIQGSPEYLCTCGLDTSTPSVPLGVIVGGNDTCYLLGTDYVKAIALRYAKPFPTRVAFNEATGYLACGGDIGPTGASERLFYAYEQDGTDLGIIPAGGFDVGQIVFGLQFSQDGSKVFSYTRYPFRVFCHSVSDGSLLWEHIPGNDPWDSTTFNSSSLPIDSLDYTYCTNIRHDDESATIRNIHVYHPTDGALVQDIPTSIGARVTCTGAWHLKENGVTSYGGHTRISGTLALGVSSTTTIGGSWPLLEFVNLPDGSFTYAQLGLGETIGDKIGYLVYIEPYYFFRAGIAAQATTLLVKTNSDGDVLATTTFPADIYQFNTMCLGPNGTFLVIGQKAYPDDRGHVWVYDTDLTNTSEVDAHDALIDPSKKGFTWSTYGQEAIYCVVDS